MMRPAPYVAFAQDYRAILSQWVSSRLYPSRIVVIADDTMIASHERLFDRDQVSFDWQHYIPLIERKPGALRNGAPFADLPNPLRLLKRGLRRHNNGDRIMTQVLAAVPIAGLDPVLVAVELVLESGSLLKCSRPTHRFCTAAFRRNQPATQGGSRCQHGPI